MKRIMLLMLATFGCASPMIYTNDVPNLVQVGPNLWRSGQPRSKKGWDYLASLGIKKDVKLNDVNEGSDLDAAADGIEIIPLTIAPEDDHPVSVFEEPDGKKIQAAVEIMKTAAPDRGVLVHCTHGQDRTGVVVGKFRREHDHWRKSAAWKEMLKNHFHPELIGLVDYWMDN